MCAGPHFIAMGVGFRGVRPKDKEGDVPLSSILLLSCAGANRAAKGAFLWRSKDFKVKEGDVSLSSILSLLCAGADCLAKGARNLEENDPKKAMVMCIHLVCCHFYLQGQTA